MLETINTICGIGRYSHFDGPVALHQRQIAFGFNGTGKSTLSDIFYSMYDENHSAKLLERKTLTTEDGTAADPPYISMTTSEGPLEFKDGKWTRDSEIYVFNDRYIDDYIFIDSNHDIGGNPVAFGREAAKCSKSKQEQQSTIDSDIELINAILLNNKDICDALGVGKTKLNPRKITQNRIRTMSELKLFPVAQREKIEGELRDVTASDYRLRQINGWEDILQKGNRYNTGDDVYAVKQLISLLQQVPKVTSQEIADHLSKFMTHKDVSWLTKGISYQANADYCPFCGQEITTNEYAKLAKKLSSYITSKQKQKADEIVAKLKHVEAYFNVTILDALFSSITQVKVENEAINILHKKTTHLLDELILPNDIHQGHMGSVAEKISTKIENPYESILLTKEELIIVKAIVKLLQKVSKLQLALSNEKENLKTVIAKTDEFKKKQALYDASFGANSPNFHELIRLAKEVLGCQSRIADLQKRIDDLVETKRLDGINTILRELNVNFSVQVHNRQYYVQISGYIPVEYKRDNKILCSEGERRVLAFAYFMLDVGSNPQDKIIVVDDPISSLDLNRKSVVAFHLVELMQNPQDQVVVLTHDISFVEKIHELAGDALGDINYMELRKGNSSPFCELDFTDYLVTDDLVYEAIIKDGEISLDPNKRLLALMALRPYMYLKTGLDANDEHYKDVERRSTYLAHTIYARSSRVTWKNRSYSIRSLRCYCNKVSKYTKLSLNSLSIVPDDFSFNGFDYDTVWQLYESIPPDSMLCLREKAMVFRILLEASLFLLVNKKTFNPERIGLEYTKAIKGTRGEILNTCKKLNELYDLSKKYHHGADNGSTLGLSALNPDEMLFFDKEISSIHDWIISNPAQCNPNTNLHTI